MINYLPETINQYSSSTRTTVASLIRQMKVGKSDLSTLVNRVSNTVVDQNFSAANIPMFSVLSKEIMIDSFRNIFLRLQSFYSAANATGIALSSMVDVFSSEIEKAENDLSKLELFIDNYEFISGKDDLYNSNYIEKFDSFVNDYKFDNLIISIPDRDGAAFVENGNSFIDGKAGVLKIGKTQDSKNVIRNIKSIKIKNNYNNYITTKTDFENLFNENFSDSWTITVKSPAILNAQLEEYKSLLGYDYTLLSGAATLSEVEFERPVSIDTIRVNPNYSNNLQLLQVVVYTDSPQQSNNLTPSENYYKLLQTPTLINGTLDLKFDKRNISKVTFIFNQSNYIRSNKTPVSSELNAKVLDLFVRSIIDDRKTRFSKYQDVVFWFFKKKNTISGISKNNYSDTDYYSYRFPQEFDSYLSNLSQQIKDFNTLVIEDRNIYTNTPIFINLMNNMLDSFSGKLNLFNNEKFIERLSSGSAPNSLSDPSFIKSNGSNSISGYNTQSISPTIANSQYTSVSSTLTQESENSYEYSFSLNSIEFIETLSQNTTKAAYVSRKIPVDGQILAVKAKVNSGLNSVDVSRADKDLKILASYELSVSNKSVPNQEQDWIPITPYGLEYVDSEVLFVNSSNNKAEIRFHAIPDSITIYKDGMLVTRGTANYSYSPQLKTITLSNNVYSPNSLFVASYKLDYSNYTPNEIDFIKRNIYIESIKSYTSSDGPGERFIQTDRNSYIKLSYAPYINKLAASQAVYNSIGGTSFIGNFSGYSPVKIQLSDGSYAVNLTNYTTGSQSVKFYNTNNTLFIHNGNGIVFNRNINTPFRVYYQYTPNDLRFRLILRKNFLDTNDPISIDSVILKMKTLNYDPYYDKINSSIS